MTLQPLEIAGMRAELLRTQLDMTCTLERNTPGSPDGYNQPAESWAPFATGLACHYWEETVVERQGMQPATAAVAIERLLLPANTVVTEKDRVALITGVDGSQVAGRANIIEVLHRELDTLLHIRTVR